MENSDLSETTGDCEALMCQLCVDALENEELPMSALEMLADEEYDFEEEEESDDTIDDLDDDILDEEEEAEGDELDDCLADAETEEDEENCYNR